MEAFWGIRDLLGYVFSEKMLIFSKISLLTKRNAGESLYLSIASIHEQEYPLQQTEIPLAPSVISPLFISQQQQPICLNS